MAQITEHFSTEEMYCKCPRCKGKTPPANVIVNLKKLANQLEKLRAKIGKPINLHCAYRCPQHNEELSGSAKNSFHMQGVAADISVQGLTTEQLFKIASGLNPNQIPSAPKNSLFTGCGYYKTSGFVHVDIGVDKVNRPITWKG